MSYLEYAAFLVIVVWFIAVARLGALREFHHFYIGMALFILGGESWVAWAGVLIALDDAAQHVVQNFRPRYRSPLWHFYALLYPELPPWLRR